MTKLFKFQLIAALLGAMGLVGACGDDGGLECPDFEDVGDVLTVPGCNAGGGQCGGDVSAGEVPICDIIPVDCAAGCIALDQEGELTPGEDGMPGNEDDPCPSTTFTVPTQDPTTVPGCCRPDGMCGFFGDFSGDLNGPNFGCVPADTFTDAGDPVSCTPS